MSTVRGCVVCLHGLRPVQIVNEFSPSECTFCLQSSYPSPSESTFTHGQSHRNDALVSVDEVKPFSSVLDTPGQLIQSTPTGVMQIPAFIPSGSAIQTIAPCPSMAKVSTCPNLRYIRSPYHPRRTYSLPVQSVSPTDTMLHTCEWVKEDGTTCGVPITKSTVSEHLIIHGVQNKTHNHRLVCGWHGCRLRKGKGVMNRESIVRHIRERHLGYKRRHCTL